SPSFFLLFFVNGSPSHSVLHSFPTRRSSDLGRVGLMVSALVIATELSRPVTGVQGKPLCALRIPLICQPPKTLPIQSARVRKTGSEEHTSELQSPCNLVCRLLLEKKKQRRQH